MEPAFDKKRTLGLATLTALVAGNMIGSGVFLLPSSLASYGSIGILAWVFTAVGAVILALIFARLSRRLPKVGGPYAYCYNAYGEFIGFQIAYNYWIALWVGNAAIVVAFVGYMSVFWPALNTNPELALIVSIITVWVVTIINVISIRYAGHVQLVTTVLKLIPLIIIGLVGLFFIHKTNLAAFNVSGKSNFMALTGAATLTFWSFIGFESATVPAENVINPTKTIPRATIIGTLIAAVVYILSAIAILGMIPLSQLAKSSSPFAEAADVIFGQWGGWIIGAAGMIACFGTLNGWILMQGQIPFAAAKDGLFPKGFDKLNRGEAPYLGLIISSVLITILLIMRYGASLVNQFTFIILLATLASLIPYLFTTFAEIVLFIKNRALFNGERMLKSFILCCIGFLFVFWGIAGAGEDVIFYGLLLFFSSIPVYVWVVWRRVTVPKEVVE